MNDTQTSITLIEQASETLGQAVELQRREIEDGRYPTEHCHQTRLAAVRLRHDITALSQAADRALTQLATAPAKPEGPRRYPITDAKGRRWVATDSSETIHFKEGKRSAYFFARPIESGARKLQLAEDRMKGLGPERWHVLDLENKSIAKASAIEDALAAVTL